MVDMKSVVSSNISAIGYDADGERLHVKFANGGEYVYHGIEPNDHERLLKAKSIGSHLHTHIKPKAAAVNKVEQ